MKRRAYASLAWPVGLFAGVAISSSLAGCTGAGGVVVSLGDDGGGSGGSSSSGGSNGGSSSGASGSGGSDSGGGSGGTSSSSSSGSSSGGGSTSSSGGGSSSGAMGDPPFGGSSKGSSGGPANGDMRQAGSTPYWLITPTTPQTPMPTCIVFSGVEGGPTMTSDLQTVAPTVGADGIAFAVLDCHDIYNNPCQGSWGAAVLDDVRSKYDVDNDRTYLLSESAGTTAGEELGFHLRESYFAAYWVNDINNPDTPGQTAAQLGFAPWGQVGPGGDFPDAMTVVAGMQSAGYRLPSPAPYDGPGNDTHGDPNQFIAAVTWLPGKARQ